MVDLDKHVRRFVPIWAAMLLFAFAFFGLAFFVNPSSKPPLPPTATTVTGFAVLALVDAVLSVLMPAQSARRVLRGARLSFRSAAPGAPETDRVLDNVDEVLPRLTAAFQQGLRAGWGTSLAVVVFGLALRSCGLPPLVVTPFLAVSVSLLLWHYPTSTKFVAVIERATDAKWPAR